MKHLVNTPAELTTVEFMGGEVEIRQLTVADVKKIDAAGKSVSEDAGFDNQLGIIKMALRMGVVNADTMTDEDFESFPMSELTSLSEKVLDVSGLGASGVNASGN
jgi:hypothetical protein